MKIQYRNGSLGPSLRLNKISRWHCCTLDSGAEKKWLRLQGGQGMESFITLVLAQSAWYVLGVWKLESEGSLVGRNELPNENEGTEVGKSEAETREVGTVVGCIEVPTVNDGTEVGSTSTVESDSEGTWVG